MNSVEDLESRLQRIKLEAAVTEEHNSRLESQQENNSDKETCKTSEDSEVCNVCLKDGIIPRLLEGVGLCFSIPVHFYW